MASSGHEDPSGEAHARGLQSARAARLMDLLGLSEDELCQILAVDPLTLLSGQIEHRPELAILLTLLDEAGEGASPAVLQRWVRTQGPAGRPLDALLKRDFAAFEDALTQLSARGFVIRRG
jgi:hypothetical protein